MESVIFQEFDNDDIRLFVQDIVNITRTLAMDPCTEIVIEACHLIKNMTIKIKELLYYFNAILSRSLFYALTHKQSRLRLAALDALDVLMTCSPFKKNVEIMENLIGFRDPNIVPIKDFYEPNTKINYLALLVSDPSAAVLRRFFEMITTWLSELSDRSDHESRLIPYIISGLFVNDEDICQYVVERFEVIGNQYMIDNEKYIREDRQYGIDAPWTKYCNKNAYYPFPLFKRPILGCRLLVKKYARRYIKNICKEFDAIDESTRVRVANLLLFSIIYNEENITEYLDEIFICFEREMSKTKGINHDIRTPLIKALKLIGRFCDYESITNLIFPTIEGKLNANYPDIQRGALSCFKYIFEGHLEALNQDSGALGIFSGKFKEIVHSINTKAFLEYMDSSTAIEVIDVIYYFILVLSYCD